LIIAPSYLLTDEFLVDKYQGGMSMGKYRQTTWREINLKFLSEGLGDTQMKA